MPLTRASHSTSLQCSVLAGSPRSAYGVADVTTPSRPRAFQLPARTPPEQRNGASSVTSARAPARITSTQGSTSLFDSAPPRRASRARPSKGDLRSPVLPEPTFCFSARRISTVDALGLAARASEGDAKRARRSWIGALARPSRTRASRFVRQTQDRLRRAERRRRLELSDQTLRPGRVHLTAPLHLENSWLIEVAVSAAYAGVTPVLAWQPQVATMAPLLRSGRTNPGLAATRGFFGVDPRGPARPRCKRWVVAPRPFRRPSSCRRRRVSRPADASSRTALSSRSYVDIATGAPPFRGGAFPPR